MATIIRRAQGRPFDGFGRLTPAWLRTGVEQLTYLLFLKVAMSVIQWLSWSHEIAPC
ncbi:MAG: hypothetical protein AB7G48_14950 [Nitrospiraceae bacterium]